MLLPGQAQITPQGALARKTFRLYLCLCLTLATLGTVQQPCDAADASSGAAAKSAPKAIKLSGKVLETMDGGGYTYVLLKGSTEKVWVAIPLTKVSVGQELTLGPGYEFKDFTSKGLNRKFDRLIFSAGVENTTFQQSPQAIKMVHEGVPMKHPAGCRTRAQQGRRGVRSQGRQGVNRAGRQGQGAQCLHHSPALRQKSETGEKAGRCQGEGSEGCLAHTEAELDPPSGRQWL